MVRKTPLTIKGRRSPTKESLKFSNSFSMGHQIPNYRFSKEKGREVSSFESALDSIKRRISNSGARKRSHPKSEPATKILQAGRFLLKVHMLGNPLIC